MVCRQRREFVDMTDKKDNKIDSLIEMIAEQRLQQIKDELKSMRDEEILQKLKNHAEQIAQNNEVDENE